MTTPANVPRVMIVNRTHDQADEQPMPATDLIRLVYISTAIEEFEPESLQQLVEHSSAKNRAHNITGMLCYRGGTFLQVLEGPREAVERLYDNIHGDDRHTMIQIILVEPIAERLFEAWNMGLCDFDSPFAADHAEFRTVAGFLMNCKGLDQDAVVLGLIRHFRAIAERGTDHHAA